MADRITKERRSWNMSRIRGRNTRCEIRLRSGLHRAGYRFGLHSARLPGRPDIVLTRFRMAIFVHGCFWHRHEGCRKAALPKTNVAFWQEKFRGTVERDRRNREQLSAMGWRTIVVWECEINRDLSQVVERIRAELEEGQDA
ncbi:MAG: very short patch repair endonuclease [Bacteroidota bacterium]|nr:very short patch repair endonuclease [Bacteroidota bacterium]